MLLGVLQQLCWLLGRRDSCMSCYDLSLPRFMSMPECDSLSDLATLLVPSGCGSMQSRVQTRLMAWPTF